MPVERAIYMIKGAHALSTTDPGIADSARSMGYEWAAWEDYLDAIVKRHPSDHQQVTPVDLKYFRRLRQLDWEMKHPLEMLRRRVEELQEELGRPLVIAVDFDGVIVPADEYPNINEADFGILSLLRNLSQQGHQIILNSCRTDKYCEQRCKVADLPPERIKEECMPKCPLRFAQISIEAMGIKLAAINQNLPERTAAFGCDSRKVSADLYIDDKCFCYRADPDNTPEWERQSRDHDTD